MRDHSKTLRAYSVRVIGAHNGRRMTLYRGSGWFSSLIDMGKRAFSGILGNGRVQGALNVIGNTAHNFVQDNKQKAIDAAKGALTDFAKEQGTQLAQNLSQAKNFGDVKSILGQNLAALPKAAQTRVSDKLGVLGKEAERALREAHKGAVAREEDRGMLDEMPFMDGQGLKRRRRPRASSRKQYVGII